MAKCKNCANLQYQVVNIGGVATIVNKCSNVNVFNPPEENKEHNCKFFAEKSGISMWDSMTKVQKQEVIKYAKEYAKSKENNMTEQKSINFFVTNLKQLDKNSN